ncbi:hypothetical protein E3N88_13046 [Mikania micrantha]|uniref:Exostosin GT47 domain-containing protein n=1 Tax=Mikania micrantha TaxID=192012 RepID=A0A5N6P9R9_9ASTR|nr:hypothetical protein E3N88_13046 [Mikania micrantha]
MAKKLVSFKGLFIMISSTLIILKMIFYMTSISSTSKLTSIHDHDDHHVDLKQPFHQSSMIFDSHIEKPPSAADYKFGLPPQDGGNVGGNLPELTGSSSQRGRGKSPMENASHGVVHDQRGRLSAGGSTHSKVYHDKDIFLENYRQMNKTMKIYVYPHAKTDPFAKIFLPDNHRSPGGNYASESYFKIALSTSHFVTQDPSKADLFFMPFSIASMRHDKRIGVGGIKSFIKDYIFSISHKYPFWNRTGGADHFYVACHSIGRTAMDEAPEVRVNAIQVVCSSSYFLQGYIAHKDASIPQIWPRLGVRPTRHPSERKMLAFYAGAMNSRVRETLVHTWINDTEISVHPNRLKTPYSDSLLGSKFCIHAKGFEVNTARIGDAIYYGCVPVILADHYDLPFGDILNWSMFSIVVSTQDVAFLKRILEKIVDSGDYFKLQKNVLMVQKHFEWHQKAVDFDTFYMLSKRRSFD